MKAAYFCEYCPDYDRDVYSAEEAEAHEATCVWNPANKHCLSCTNYDLIMYNTQDSNGKTFTTSARGCTVKHVPINSAHVSNCARYNLRRNHGKV